ncbi:hypothetical protein IKF26_01185 [Candidatus Saccharibacteria bacterium]|nr:hypothetical protein [Candidatus Saccharibacteria bacterium]
MTKIATLELPKEVVDSSWEDDVDTSNFDYQLYGKSEEGEIAYKLIKKPEAKDSTLDYKNKRIGHVAIFNREDKLVA